MVKTLVMAWAIVLAISAFTLNVAQAQPDPSYEVNVPVDATVTAAALVGTFLMMLVPVDTDNRWDSELFGQLDESVKNNFSASAAKLSDTLIVATMIAPLLLQLDQGFNKQAGERTLLYGESIAASLLLNSVTKYLVKRPRPYVYHRDPQVQQYVRDHGKDSHVSFYSGHASTAFTAAVAGSYLFALESDSDGTKAAVWGLEMGMASATALLRVRAGKHFYSDVILGFLIGSAFGVVVPALHSQSIYRPSGLEWAAMAAGVGIGGLTGHLMPIDDDVLMPVRNQKVGLLQSLHNLRLSPMPTRQGAGLALSANF